MVQNDSLWRNIAQSIANFKPARRLELTETIVDTAVNGPQTLEHEHHPAPSTQPSSIPSGSANQLGSTGSPQLRWNQGSYDGAPLSHTGKRKVRCMSPGGKGHVAKRSKQRSPAQARKGFNPAFKLPISRLLKSGKSELQQDTPRPKLAPSRTVLVPQTTSPKMRRAFSEVVNTSSRQKDSTSADILPTSKVDETSFVYGSATLSDSLEIRDVRPPQSNSENNSHERHLFPGNQEQLVIRKSLQNSPTSSVDDEVVSFTLSRTSLRDSELEMGTVDPMIRHQGTNDSEYSIVDQDSFASHPTTSTETPSDPNYYLSTSSPLARRSIPTSTQVIDLTSENESPLQQVTRRDVLGPVSSPLRNINDEDTEQEEGGDETTSVNFERIMSLPQRIRCPVPSNHAQDEFSSFITKFLLDLAEKFDLINCFRPLQAVNSIANTTRGYWKLLIGVADRGSVAKARRSPLTMSQWSDKRFMLRQDGQLSADVSTPEGDVILKDMMYPPISPNTLTLWTADEFEDFWLYLTKVVESGRIGAHVRATIESRRLRQNGLDIEVRLWSYAEALSHQWLVLYGVSSRLTGRMPLQWFKPGFKDALITMSGQPKHDGSIGRWIEKKRGEHGMWGLEEDWEGLNGSSRGCPRVR